MRDGVENFRFNHSLVFLVTGSHPEATQEPTKSHRIRIKDTPIAQEVALHLRDLGALCQGLGAKIIIDIVYYFTPLVGD